VPSLEATLDLAVVEVRVGLLQELNGKVTTSELSSRSPWEMRVLFLMVERCLSEGSPLKVNPLL
jgi:hypothetical protein